jgi:hypothetical protein
MIDRSKIQALAIYAMVLPAALVVGYLMATPLDFTTLVVVGLLFVLLITPILLKWHRPMLFLSWNMLASVFFLPGRPQLWMVMAILSLTISAVQRTLVRDMRFIRVPFIWRPMTFLTAVILFTAKFTGGVGLSLLGSGVVGGKRYLDMLGAVIGFLAMTARPIPPEKAKLYTALFFLGCIPNLIGDLFPYLQGAGGLTFIFLVFPVQTFGSSGALSEEANVILRLGGTALASIGVFVYLLAQSGLKEPLAKGRFGRLLLLFLALVACAFGGYRAFLILLLLTAGIYFYMEDLFRWKYIFVLVGTILLVGATTIPLADKLPLGIQRSLAFLPLEINPVARVNAEESSDWRIKIWQLAVRDVPRYFWLGKGLAFSPGELEQLGNMTKSGLISAAEGTLITGDYHNGPLTVAIPFGIWGMIGWLWLLGAGTRALYLNYVYGEESLKKVNTALFSFFLAKIVLFFAIFGSFHYDFSSFLGILGLSLSLNYGVRRPARGVALARPVPIRFRAPIRPAASLSHRLTN